MTNATVALTQVEAIGINESPSAVVALTQVEVIGVNVSPACVVSQLQIEAIIPYREFLMASPTGSQQLVLT